MISVIVPVYNVEKYLDKCIQSILNQTYTDFELILINDGSIDNSGMLCEQYAKQDKRVIVIHRENGGPSAARNEASISSKGEYITFIDSDDFITEDYLEKLNDALITNMSDISAVLMREVDEDETQKIKDETERIVNISGYEALLNVLYQKDLDTTPCGMLFKRELVLCNPFPEGRFHEDDFTMYKYFETAKRVSIIRSEKYFYVQHKTSIMHQKNIKIIQDEIDASDNLEQYFSNKGNKLLKAAKTKKFSNYCQIILESGNIISREKKKEIKKYLYKNRRNVLTDSCARFKNRIAALSLYFGEFGLFTLYKISRFIGF